MCIAGSDENAGCWNRKSMWLGSKSFRLCHVKGLPKWIFLAGVYFHFLLLWIQVVQFLWKSKKGMGWATEANSRVEHLGLISPLFLKSIFHIERCFWELDSFRTKSPLHSGMAGWGLHGAIKKDGPQGWCQKVWLWSLEVGWLSFASISVQSPMAE